MTDLHTHSLELLALAKAFEAKSGYLTGSYKHKLKHNFKNVVTAMELFIKEAEKGLTQQEIEAINDHIENSFR